MAIPPVFPQKNLLMAIYLGDCALGLLDKGSELTLIPRDPKEHPGPPVGLRAYEDQVKSEVLDKVQLTVGPLDPQIHVVATLYLFPPLTRPTPWESAGRATCTGLGPVATPFPAPAPLNAVSLSMWAREISLGNTKRSVRQCASFFVTWL